MSDTNRDRMKSLRIRIKARINNRKKRGLDFKKSLDQLRFSNISLRWKFIGMAFLVSFMPDFNLVKFYYEQGGRLITVGSDSHQARHVGSDIYLAYEMIKYAGFSEITTYTKRVPEFKSLNSDVFKYAFVQ